MMELEVRPITVANLPDLVSPCILSGTLATHATLPSAIAEEMTRRKLAYFHDRMRSGAAAMAAYRGPRVVGLMEYYPVEVAPIPVEGNDLFVVNCLQVPESEHREAVEKELVAACVKDWSSRKGVVVLGREKQWDVLGFERVLTKSWPEGDDLVLWLMKFWEVEEPRLRPVHDDFPVVRGRVRVDVFTSGRCPWEVRIVMLVEEVCGELGKDVLLERRDLESRADVLKYGLSAGIAVNGDYQPWLQPHPVPTKDQVRRKIEDLL